MEGKSENKVMLLTVLFYLVGVCYNAVLDGTLLLNASKDQAVLYYTPEAKCLSLAIKTGTQEDKKYINK